MKISEVVVGTAGSEAFMFHNAPADDVAPRQDKRPPQVGYKLRIGNRVIGTPRYNAKDASSTIGINVPS
jgi:hypothetical protein